MSVVENVNRNPGLIYGKFYISILNYVILYIQIKTWLELNKSLEKKKQVHDPSGTLLVRKEEQFFTPVPEEEVGFPSLVRK